MKEVVARIIDDSDFLEFKQEYDALTVCGWAKMGGVHIGIITNNGPITPQGAAKQHSLFICVNRPNDHFYSCITLQVLWWEQMLNKTALLSMVRN
jgi:hypothetical protein